MGACCASGGRDGTLDQKEDKLAGPELKKGVGAIEDAVEEKAGKSQQPESPEEAEFRTKVSEIRSEAELINVTTNRSHISL